MDASADENSQVTRLPQVVLLTFEAAVAVAVAGSPRVMLGKEGEV